MRLTSVLLVSWCAALLSGGCGSDSGGGDAGCEGDACGACNATCDENATCADEGACVCNQGFTGDGLRCADSDECADGAVAACGDGATSCLNGVGSYACFCGEGFVGTGTTACADLDECATAGEGCSEDPAVECTNSVGSFSCGDCPEGFTGDGVTCTDINECVTTTNGGCGDPAFYTCTNMPGSFACSDTDECAVNNGGCDPLTTCTNNEGTAPTCGECPAGYRVTWDYGNTPWPRGTCYPQLTGLNASPTPIAPAFAANTLAYRAQVYVSEETVRLTASVPEDATLTINGEAVPSGTAWQTPTLDVGDNDFTIVVSRSEQQSTTYTVTVARSIQQAFIKASNSGAGNEFSHSVALSGDTLVVGAWGEASNVVGINGDQLNMSAPGAGAAYVFVRNGNTWSQQAYLKASNTEANDLFGTAVAIDGDTIVVTAYGEDSGATGANGNQLDNSASGAGAAYVFVRNGNTWSQQAYLKASNTEANDLFGTAVAIHGDTIVVTASGEDSGATGANGNQPDNSASGAGAAYVFLREGTTWSQQAYLKASNTDAGDRFGDDVSVSGDVILVGASGEASTATGVDGDQTDNSASEAGAAYVFVREGTTWSQQAYLKSGSPPLVQRDGFSVAVSGETAVLGSSNANSVTVYVRSGDVWSHQAALHGERLTGSSGCGYQVAISGNRVVAGAPDDRGNGAGVNPTVSEPTLRDSGAACVFERAGVTWSQTLLLKAHNPSEDMAFGGQVAISGDWIAIGARGETSATNMINGPQTGTGSNSSGAVYVFH